MRRAQRIARRCRSSLQRGQAQNTPNDAHAPDTASTSSTESIGASMANRFQALQSSTASGSVASEPEAAASASDGGGSDHDADMEIARKLQEEEDRIHYERMLQMAGIGDPPDCVLADAAQSMAVTHQKHSVLHKLTAVTSLASKLRCNASNKCPAEGHVRMHCVICDLTVPVHVQALRYLLSTGQHFVLRCSKPYQLAAGAAEEDAYLSDDSVDPDNMTYEVCQPRTCFSFWQEPVWHYTHPSYSVSQP